MRVSSETAALGELLDLLKHERRLVAGAGVFMTATHLRHRRIALGGSRVPVQTLPLGPQELAEGVSGRQPHPDPERSQLLDRRDAQVLWLTDTHTERQLTVRGAGAASQGRRGPVALESVAVRPDTAIPPEGGLRHGTVPQETNHA